MKFTGTLLNRNIHGTNSLTVSTVRKKQSESTKLINYGGEKV